MAKGKPRTKKEQEKMVSKIIPLIQRTGSLKKACIAGGISYESMNRYRKADELLDIEITKAENYRQFLSETVLLESIQKNNTTDAKWLLERVDKNTYSVKQEFEGNANITINTNVK